VIVNEDFVEVYFVNEDFVEVYLFCGSK